MCYYGCHKSVIGNFWPKKLKRRLTNKCNVCVDQLPLFLPIQYGGTASLPLILSMKGYCENRYDFLIKEYVDKMIANDTSKYLLYMQFKGPQEFPKMVLMSKGSNLKSKYSKGNYSGVQNNLCNQNA